jgi:hypothetical protein
MKTLYQNIRSQIESETSVTHVRLWNNQVSFAREGQQIPWNGGKAVFIDFPNIPWLQGGKGTQRTGDNFYVRLYLVFESYNTSENEEDLALFDFREEVYLAVQDFKPTQASKLSRINENTDTSHDNLYVWIMDFSTTFQDVVAQFPRGGVTAEIETLTLTKDLIIAPGTVDGIRTDKEFP